jgi:hypothetical protein
MRSIPNNSAALAAFVARKTEIDTCAPAFFLKAMA